MTNAATPKRVRDWYPDPFSKGELLRLFDGAQWTDQTRPIPDNYKPSHPSNAGETSSAAPAKSESDRAADAAAPRANPSNAPALSGHTSKPKEKKPDPPKGKPAKNGTAPLFSTPTTKAATGPDKDTPAATSKESVKSESKATAAPAFASPTVTAEKPDDPAPGAGPAPSFAKQAPADAADSSAPMASSPTGFAFAKPAEPDRTPERPDQAPVREQQTPRRETQAGPQSPSAVDAEPDEDSESVTNAFATAPQEAEFSDEVSDEGFNDDGESSPRIGRRERSRAALQGAVRNVRLVTWVVTALVALAAVFTPMLVESPVRGVAKECKPISKVIVSYDGATDFSVNEKTQATLASAVSTGELDKDLTAQVTTAVEKNNLQPVVERCLPQEK